MCIRGIQLRPECVFAAIVGPAAAGYLDHLSHPNHAAYDRANPDPVPCPAHVDAATYRDAGPTQTRGDGAVGRAGDAAPAVRDLACRADSAWSVVRGVHRPGRARRARSPGV